MITLEKCRSLLGPVDVTDSDVKEIREQLYSLAHIFIESRAEADVVPKREGDSISKRVAFYGQEKNQEGR